MTDTTRLIVGYGYVGSRVARCWRARGDQVFAVTRSAARVAEMTDDGLQPVVWDWLSHIPPLPPDLPSLTTILIAVSHAQVPGLDPKRTHTDGLKNLAAWIGDRSPGARWIYLSTTGVFATSTDGAWMDERSPVGPSRPGSIAALEGERWIESQLTSAHRVVLRPAGIYGPNRVPRLDAIRDSIPLNVDPDSYLNLIHVDDLVEVILRVSDAITPSSLYCVCDGNSPTRREYYQAISDMMSWPEPVFANPTEPLGETEPTGQEKRPRGIARSEGNKRVSGRRLFDEIPIRLTYPSYRDGLRPLLVESS